MLTYFCVILMPFK